MTNRRALWLMILVVAAWGASYMWMKVALVSLAPLMLLGLRFTVAFLVTGVVFHNALQRLTRHEVKVGLILGTLLFLTFAPVLVGLQHTSAATVGFLTSTTAIFVIVLTAIIQRTWPTPVATATTLTMLLGLYLMLASGPLQMNGGALFCILAAVVYAIYILVTSHYAHQGSAGLGVSVLQLGVAGVEGLIASAFAGQVRLPQTPTQWGAVLALGLICSAFGFIVQTNVQHYLTAVTVGLIYSLEPIFAAGFAFYFLNERLSPRQLIGAAIVFTSVTIAQLAQSWAQRRVRAK